jgi:PKD repeat protein
MVDIVCGPYKDTKALYVVSRSEVGSKIRRIRYTGTSNRSPVANIKVKNTAVNVDDTVSFDGTGSSDPDGDVLTYKWDFGDGGTSTLGKPSHVFKKKGTFIVSLTVTDKFGQTDQLSVDIAVGKPPTATMISPVSGDKFYVGEVFRLSGSAVDSSGVKLSSSQLFWEVRQHHGEHYHPFLDRTAGNNFDMEPAPGPEDFIAATNSYLEVIMYAEDKDGLITTVSRILKPEIVKLNITSVPSGMQVLIDDYPVTTPKMITSWAKHDLRLNVKDDAPYVFKSWSDGGARSHTVNLPIGSSKSFQVTFVKGSTTNANIPLVKQVRACSSSNKCGRCEGHCESSVECQGSLVCFKKGGRGKSVPGCIGIDNSNTDWCTVM